MKKRIAFVVQRYGEEINGGAEQQAKRMAEAVSLEHNVEVITTTALHESFESYYTPGRSVVNGVNMLRFKSVSKNLIDASKYNQIMRDGSLDEQMGEYWAKSMGPYVPKLMKYLESNYSNYDIFIFITYLFYTTVIGLPKVAGKAVFFPTAHDEDMLYFQPMYKVFNAPRYMMFNSEEERKLVHSVFNNSHIPNEIVGDIIEVPKVLRAEEKKKEYGEYICTVGRISKSRQLVKFFLNYKKSNPGNLKLVSVGRKLGGEPESEDIIYTGFVSDDEKFDVMAGAIALVAPSRWESLCLVLLESLAVGVPVLVNEMCYVTRAHCERSNAGLYYSSYEQFEMCLNWLLTHPAQAAQMGENGKKYIAANYSKYLMPPYLNRILEEMYP